jgi:DNA-binding FadR family transcriptional regulator
LNSGQVTLGEQPLGPLRAATTGEQVAHRLSTAIALGEFSLGDRLPSERELAALHEEARPHHRALAEAVIGGDEKRAADIAGEHFAITENALRRLVARVDPR